MFDLRVDAKYMLELNTVFMGKTASKYSLVILLLIKCEQNTMTIYVTHRNNKKLSLLLLRKI